jgi:hypothetical protein
MVEVVGVNRWSKRRGGDPKGNMEWRACDPAEQLTWPRWTNIHRKRLGENEIKWPQPCAPKSPSFSPDAGRWRGGEFGAWQRTDHSRKIDSLVTICETERYGFKSQGNALVIYYRVNLMGQKKELRSPGHNGLRNSSNRLARCDLVRGKKFLPRPASWRRNCSVVDEAPTLRPRGAKQSPWARWSATPAFCARLHHSL